MRIKFIHFLAWAAFTVMSGAALGAGWTVPTKITSVGQYGVNTTFFTTEAEVSQCGDKKRLFFYTQDATDLEKFNSVLLTAFAAGKKIKVYLHDPIECGGQ
ncbi:hypothetical protein, partial [Pseudoalteromonas luteoviolacea]|uniref:hypothetical protein n=1 Tax=Pseudoalteromonas luteoviolacea TaxID=43657 RepID=UPI000AACCE7F